MALMLLQLSGAKLLGDYVAIDFYLAICYYAQSEIFSIIITNIVNRPNKPKIMKNFMKKLIGLSIVLGFLAFAGQVQAVGAPVIVSAYASNITQSSASLNGVVNPNGSSSFAWYETPNGGPFGVVNIGTGTNNVNVLPYTLSGLSPNK